MDPGILSALLIATALPAQAETYYKWVDERGQVNYSNTPPPRAAGKTQAVEDRISVMGLDPGVRAAAERRFAAQEYAEEQDWQLRQQAMAAEQYYYSQSTSIPYDSGYGYDYPYYPYYGAYYYPGHVRRPLLARAFVNHSPHVSHFSQGRSSQGMSHGVSHGGSRGMQHGGSRGSGGHRGR